MMAHSVCATPSPPPRESQLVLVSGLPRMEQDRTGSGRGQALEEDAVTGMVPLAEVPVQELEGNGPQPRANPGQNSYIINSQNGELCNVTAKKF